MKEAVFDTALVWKANGDVAGRRLGNSLDKRLLLLEEAVSGRTATLVNKKLLNEYQDKVISRGINNESIRSFWEHAIDRGVDSGRSTLEGAGVEKAKKARWPPHDYHLLAAADGHDKVSIYVTEKKHSECAEAIKKKFGYRVVPT